MSRIRLDGTGLEPVPGLAVPTPLGRLVASAAGDAVEVEGTEAPPFQVAGRAVRATRAADAAADDGPWRVSRADWYAQGLTIWNEDTGERHRLGLETPFLQWSSLDPTRVGDHLVVYALGPHVVLLDLPTRRLAVLAEGRSPVVVLDP